MMSTRFLVLSGRRAACRARRVGQQGVGLLMLPVLTGSEVRPTPMERATVGVLYSSPRLCARVPEVSHKYIAVAPGLRSPPFLFWTDSGWLEGQVEM